MNLRERLRRWWKPADYEDGHPLSEAEREASSRSFEDERGKLDTYTSGGRIHIEDDFRRP